MLYYEKPKISQRTQTHTNLSHTPKVLAREKHTHTQKERGRGRERTRNFPAKSISQNRRQNDSG